MGSGPPGLPVNYRHVWPVEDPTMSRAELLAIADLDLRRIVATLGRRMLSAPRWTWQHKNGPELVAVVAVSGKVSKWIST